MGQKASQPFQFNVMHVIPSSKMPVEKLPLDVLISNAISFNRKQERRANATQANTMAEAKFAQAESHWGERDAMEKEATVQGLVMLPEYSFDHCVYQITENALTEEGLVYGYNKCMNFLRLKNRPDVGVTCIVAPKWMYMSVLSEPYTTNTNGNPVYLDGFCFAGLVSLQTVASTWPATAGLENDEPTIMEALGKSTFIQPVVEDPDDDDHLQSESAVEIGAASSNKDGRSERSGLQ